MLDVDRNEIYEGLQSRNSLATRHFINEVLNYCEGGMKFIVDNAPWLKLGRTRLKIQSPFK